MRSSKSSVFDGKRLKAYNDLLDTPFEKKLFEFDYKLDVISLKIINNAQNVAINLERRNGQRFVTPRLINTLRYTYFEKLEPLYEKICARLVKLPKPDYWLKVWDYDAYNHCHLFGALCKKNLLVVDQALVQKSLRDRKVTERAFKEGKKVKYYEDEPSRETPIRDVWHSSSFWRDVFYDTRLASTTEDIDEWLPQIDVVQRFFITLTDYALYNLHCLDCKMSSVEKATMSASEASSLEQQYFFYFNDGDYAFFHMMARVFNDTFLQLIRTFLTKEDEVLEKTREVMKVLVETICSNLQINYFGGKGVDVVLEMWHEFLLMALEKLVIANLKPVVLEHATEEKELPDVPRVEEKKPETRPEHKGGKKKKTNFFARLCK